MSTARTGDLWWKNAVIYCLDVATFADSCADGFGDLDGLTDRIDHLTELGVTCLWLMPFYPSPARDDGYDVTDHYGVHPRLGDLGDAVTLVRTAKDRGLRVIIDLVVNHTSDQHPWFQAAREDRDSRYRDHYVWRDEPQDDPHADPMFPDAEDSIWSYDEAAGQYYLHHFFSHQPDLNIASEVVREEVARIAGFWLQLGVDGFRVDAVPFMLETGGLDDLDLDPHDYLKDLRSFITRRRGDALLLGEVNLPTDELVRYFGSGPGDELQMQFAFPLNQRLFLSLAREDAGPLAAALDELPAVSDDTQWAPFIRSHDELTLDQLTDDEREEVFAAFGPEPDMQVFDRGIRRRLPPMLDGDQRRIRLVYSLLFSLPGTPVLFYGEEIGMGENLDVDGRLAVRTPMQWTDGPTAGFSDVDPTELVRPVVDGPFGPQAVNVAAQSGDPDSLLSWMQRTIRRRRRTPEFGWGAWAVLESGDPAVLVHRCTWEGRTVVAVHNLSATPRTLDLDLSDGDTGSDQDPPTHVCDLLADDDRPQPLDAGTLHLDLHGYGHHWFRPVREEPT